MAFLKATERPVSFQYGKPPHRGWWYARYHTMDDVSVVGWRWWDGENWGWWRGEDSEFGLPSGCVAPKDHVLIEQRITHGRRDCISWSWHWPGNATQARVNPDTMECTGSGPEPDIDVLIAIDEFRLKQYW
ncbi:hypothetical protein [Delftia phage PhiW-14]|uniref:Uncharacterized protein n=1 Tax=Delftia phage PhiW-14 TaxID=665032 RepID=C9DG75_BPW14|nr:hypothetical protein DP-phiW-14_gp105 [Delftia phage PhiW-14]ACV50126.1 hypothetical protein [Delftia phage PhiW-14]